MDMNVGLAPMEGVSDFSFRVWLSLCSLPDFMGTPFLRLTDSFPKHIPKDWAPEIFYKAAFPYKLIPQFMGPSPERFIEVSHLILTMTDEIELNCGCPSPKVVGRGAGSSLLKNVNDFVSYIEDCSKSLGSKKMSVKMRTGYDNHLLFNELIEGIADFDLNRVTIHGRTKADKYLDYANWNQIHNAASILRKAQVYGSGDICNIQTYLDRVNLSPNVDGYLIGRGALRNPWIFEEIRQQKPVIISIDALIAAIKAYVYIMEGFKKDFENFVDFFLSLDLYNHNRERDRNSHSVDLDYWVTINDSMKTQFFPGQKLEPNRKTFGKVKMLWNYLRSSLPVEFWNPMLLRARTLEHFFDCLKDVDKERSIQNGKSKYFRLLWNQDRDWIYAGGKSKVLN